MLKALATENEKITPVRGAHSTPTPVLMALATENEKITPVRGAHSTPTPVLVALAAENKGITPVRGAYSTPTPVLKARTWFEIWTSHGILSLGQWPAWGHQWQALILSQKALCTRHGWGWVCKNNIIWTSASQLAYTLQYHYQTAQSSNSTGSQVFPGWTLPWDSCQYNANPPGCKLCRVGLVRHLNRKSVLGPAESGHILKHGWTYSKM